MSGSIPQIIQQYEAKNKGNLIQILQDVQRAEGYIPGEAVDHISSHLWISRSEIFGVASFYSQFKFNPPANKTDRYSLQI